MVDHSCDTQALDSSIQETKTKAQKEWKLLKNVLTASFLLKTHEVKVVSDIDQLVEEIKNNPVKINTTHELTLTNRVISDHRATENFFYYIQRSKKEDLIEINNLIENNPKKFTRNQTDPDSFINKANNNGIRPIYEACKNGHLNTVQLLLDHGANPHLLSRLDIRMQENSLQVSCRWNYINIIKSLLAYSNWSQKEIKNALKETNQIEVVRFLKSKIINPRLFCFCKR